jgi:predicted ABC-type transport system involved in lysophospholipase L1 biosynthesis ATPase subunit
MTAAGQRSPELRPGPAEPAIAVEGVDKSFGPNQVLSGINLSVATHEVICLIGASGSGKSTLLRCINLLEPINAGRILLLGQDVTGPGVDANVVRRHVGIVFQSYNLFPHMTVLRNVTLGPMKALRMPKAQAEEAAADLLARFGLADKRSEYPDRLSGGQQRAGSRARRRGARRDQRAGGRRDDHADRNARDGLCQGHRQPDLLPRRGPDHRGRATSRPVHGPEGRPDPPLPAQDRRRRAPVMSQR